MMQLKRSIVLMCVLVFSSLVTAQSSPDGTWTGQIPGGRGPQEVTLNLKAESGKLTGTLVGGRGGSIAIEEGTISGADLKFKTKQMGRGGEVVFNWSGTLKGNEIAFSRMADGGQGEPQKFTLTRQK